MTESLALTREWYKDLEAQASKEFVALPLEYQTRGYSYNTVAEHYLTFFKGDNTRADNLRLAKKFQKFIRNINRNRVKQELGEAFFECFHYFMENFAELTSKQDFIHLETLDLISEGLDKSNFVEDVINVDELKNRVIRLKAVEAQEEIIGTEWKGISSEYEELNAPGKVQELSTLQEDPTVLCETKIFGSSKFDQLRGL